MDEIVDEIDLPRPTGSTHAFSGHDPTAYR